MFSFFLSEPPSDSSAISSSSRMTSNIVVEMQMDEQMSKGQAKLSPTKSLNTFRSISSDSEANKSAPKESNGFQLDSRLTKMAPIKSSSIGTNSSIPNETAIASTSAAANVPIRLIMSNAGKAMPYKALVEKVNGNNRVEVLNGNVNTAYGQLAKISCITAKTKSWELLAGSPIVNFCLCAKYVLICCLDGTIQFVDIKTGLAVLPKLKMLSPVVQCVFVRSKLTDISKEFALIFHCLFVEYE